MPHQLIEVQLVEELYGLIARELLEAGLVEPGYLSSREVVIFYSAKPELFILPSGALFISESLLERVLKIKGDAGLECLSYLLLKELVHLIEGHLQANIQEAQKYGDLRRQLFFF